MRRLTGHAELSQFSSEERFYSEVLQFYSSTVRFSSITRNMLGAVG